MAHEAYPPGTLNLEHFRDDGQDGTTGEIILHPRPSRDPNDPLNWSKLDKSINFGLACFYTLVVFVNLDVGTVAWNATTIELGYTLQQQTWGFALNCLGLAFGCVILIPFALKYGRRPMYLFTITIGLATALWQAKMENVGDLYGSNLLSGLAGSVAETICQMTIADIFFVHQRATANGVYLMMMNIGAFLGPVAAGYSANSQGWRWMFWWTGILFAICLVAFVFLYEDTKYTRVTQSQVAFVENGETDAAKLVRNSSLKQPPWLENPFTVTQSIEGTIPVRKSYRRRMNLARTSHGQWNVFFQHVYLPFYILLTFPAVAFTAVTYGSLLAWFSIIVSVYSSYLTYPPYNFDTVGVGLMNLAPFIGGVLGSIYGGLLSDKLVIRLSRRNKGIFAPEMRLWMGLPMIVLLPGSILIFGLPISRGLHWSICTVGAGLFGFSFVSLGDAAITYAMDCYKGIIGDAFIAVAFVRNAFATIIAMLLTDWINGLGLDGFFAMSAGLSGVLTLLIIPMMIWGKRARAMTQERLARLSVLQFDGEEDQRRAASSHSSVDTAGEGCST